jgi:hypothetical protein
LITTLYFLATPQSNMWSSTTYNMNMFSSFWTIHWTTNGLTSGFHLETNAHHTFSNMFFDKIFETHRAWILSCSNHRAIIWFITQWVFPTFQLFSLVFFTIFWTQLGLSHPLIASLFNVCAHIPLTLQVSTSYVTPMVTNA